MGRTPDRTPGVASEEGIVFDNLNPGEETTSPGSIAYVSGAFVLRDNAGTFDPRSGSGVSAAQHRTLRQLVHLADGGGPFEGFTTGAYQEILPSANPFPTSIIWWTSVAKTHKIVELALTYNVNKTVATQQWKAYDTDGSTVLATVTDTWAYSGVFPTSRTRAIV